MIEAFPVDDDQDRDRPDEKSKDDEAEELDDEDMDYAIQAARFGLDRLKVAIRFVQDEVPPYGHTTDNPGEIPPTYAPPSIDLVRRRALIAAYGLIEREFSPQGDPG